MDKLKLLFAKDSLQYQLLQHKKVVQEKHFLETDETPHGFLLEKLTELLAAKNIEEIEVVSALNHFAMTAEGFSEHELGYDLIGYNAAVDREHEELMLSVNKKFGVQFYYTFPKNLYQKIKSTAKKAFFNFSGEKFLNSLTTKNQKEIHINLYHQQCEFFALDHRKVILYNNLDLNSEVDFLYFIMFSLSKIGFGIDETHFFVYGETTENETFISELKKFVRHLKIVFDNLPQKNFVLN